MRICIIPARAGSKRIPNKNKRPFFGKPMIMYPLLLAAESCLFDRVIVSTDDKEIAEFSNAFMGEFLGDGVRFSMHERAPYWAGDDIPTLNLIREILLDQVKETLRMQYKLHGPDPVAKISVCVIYPCSPMLNNFDLLNGMQLLYSSNMDYAFSVGTEPLRDAGNYYWGWLDAWIGLVPIHGPRSIMVPIPEERCCDINTEKDWAEAERKYSALTGEDIWIPDTPTGEKT